MALGAAALGGGLTLSTRYAAAQARIDITHGKFQPIPIAIPKFIAGTERRRHGQRCQPDRRRQSAAQRSVQSDRSRGLYRNARERRQRADLSEWRVVNAQALVRRHHAAERRTAES